MFSLGSLTEPPDPPWIRPRPTSKLIESTAFAIELVDSALVLLRGVYSVQENFIAADFQFYLKTYK